jgi:hypothetical protein
MELRGRLLDLGLPTLPLLLLVGHAALLWDYTSAETATVLAYARTLGEGGGLALTPQAVQSHGFASLLWVLLLGAASGLGLPLLITAKVTGLLCALCALWLLPRLLARLVGRAALRPVDLLAPLLLAVNPTVGRHAADGLETSLTLLLLTVALWLFVGEEGRVSAHLRPRMMLWSSIPLALLMLSRPEAPAICAALLVGRLVARLATRRLDGGTLLWTALLAAVYAGYLAWSYAHFADPWPAAFAARQAVAQTQLGSPEAIALGWGALRRLGVDWGLAPVLVVAVVGALRGINHWARFALAGVIVAVTAATLLGGGDDGRRTAPVLVPLAVLFADGLDSLLRRVGLLRGAARTLVTLAMPIGLLAAPIVYGARAVTAPTPSPFAADAQRFSALAEQVRTLGFDPAQVRVLTTSPGAAAWQGFAVVDASGLTDMALRRHARGRTQTLQRLVLRERRPDLLLEEGPWLRGLARTPEAQLLYVPVPELHLDLARRLLLDPEPRLPSPLRVSTGRGLWLVGARLEPDRLVLLWMADQLPVEARSLRVLVGEQALELTPSNPFYPIARWRPGEIVRQVVPLATPEHMRRVSLRIDGTPLRGALDVLSPQERWTIEVARRRDRDLDPSTEPVDQRALRRATQLLARNLLEPAAAQLEAARATDAPPRELRRVAAALGRAARQRALEEASGGQLPSAYASLRVAASADPPSAWLARRLEEARQQLPAPSHYLEELELDVARRALALVPSSSTLARVMETHLALRQPHLATDAYLAWRTLVTPDRPLRLLLARALAEQGYLEVALGVVDALVREAPALRLPRRCPGWDPLEPLLLQARLRADLGLPASLLSVERFADPPILVAGGELVSHCARWEPGGPLMVELFHLARDRGTPATLRLRVGEREVALLVAPGATPLQRLETSFALPPATYSLQLISEGEEGTRAVDLGLVQVGPETNFGFELPSFAGWTVEGSAFGAAPALVRAARDRPFGVIGERFADSFVTRSDRATGRLTSPPFRLRRDFLLALVAGGDDPRLAIELRVRGGPTLLIHGDRTETLRAVFLPIAAHRGQLAEIVIRDDAVGDWGHLAVDEIRQLDGPAPGIAP